LGIEAILPAQERGSLLYNCLGWIIILAVVFLIFVGVLLIAVMKRKCPACKSRSLRPAKPSTITLIAASPAEGGGWALLRCAACRRFIKTPISGKGSKYELALENEVPPDLRGT